MNTVRIELGRGKFAVIDAIDWELVKGYSWGWLKPSAKDIGGTGYAQAGVTVAPGTQVIVRLHRLITGAQKGQVVDFADHNGLNCTRVNLRLCSRLESTKNARGRRQSSTGHRNVMKKGEESFLAAIRKAGVRYEKYFPSLEEAVRWAEEKRKELHGQFTYDKRADKRGKA